MILQTLQSLSQKHTLEYLAFVLILVLATVFSCYRIAEPAWDGTHYGSSLHGVSLDGWHGFTLYEWGEVARNYLKFGYFATKLGQARDHGWTKPEGNFAYRIDHPPLPPLLVSVSFRLFGIHEWSIRLIPVLSSLLIPILIFILMSKWGGKKTALLASFFLVLTPMYAYYSRLPTWHIPASSFSLLTFVFYYWWMEIGKRWHYLGMYASLVLGMLSEWTAYFVVPAILLHYIIYRHRKASKFVLSFGILPAVFLITHFGWSYLLEEGSVGHLFYLLISAIFSVTGESLRTFTMWDFYAATYTRAKFFLTPTICVLSIVWFIDFLLIPLPKKLSRQNMFLAVFFLFGLSHNLLFANLVYIHDFVMFFHLLPFFAITAALGAQHITERVLMNKWQWTTLFILAICYLCGKQSIFALERLHSTYIDADRFLIGSKVNEIADRDAIVVGNFEPDPYMAFYADRSWQIVRNLQDLTSQMQINSYLSHYILHDGSSVDGELRQYLVRNHPVEISYGYSFFNLQEAGSNTILQDPQIEHPAKVNFGDKVMFLGYNVEEMIPKKPEPSWLDKYLNAHAELMPEHRTTFRITYFWRCLAEMEQDYTLVTQFEGHHGKTYRIDQSHQGVNRAYPTSMWQVGEIISEEYQVEVPADYPPIRYALWVRIQDGEERLEVVSDVEVDEENRVRLGEIEVLPAEEPSPLAAEPRSQNRVEVNINDELVFLGYDLSESNPQPGDQLKVTTYWQSLRKTERDYAIQVELRNGEYKVREILDIAPTRLWEEGKYYRGDAVIALNPHLLGGTYSLNLGLEKDDGTGPQVSLASLDIPCHRRHIIRRLGKANSGGSQVLSPNEPLSLRFDLKEGEALELVVGWTGKAGGEETRVEVYITNAHWRERYLGTWVVQSRDYRVTKRKIGKVFTAPGENVIELRISEVREKAHNVGWRGWVDLAFPDLLQDPRIDYDGPIQMDFVQVSSRWEGDWDDYYDLAKVYAERGMMGEVAKLYKEAVEKGAEPAQVDDLALFKGAYAALAERGKVSEIEKRIAERITHKMNVNLGGKVEFLGHSLRGKEGDDHGLSLFFRCLEEMEEDYTLWVHGEVEDESLLEGQRSEAGYAVFDHLLPTSRWQVGGVYQDDEVRGLRPGRYHLTLGLWRSEDGSRLWLKDDPNAHVIDLGWIETK
jgi:hypothetical protein